MDPITNRKQSFFSEWLEKLQQESWQLELLISGLALFGIWESQNLLIRFDYYLDIHITSDVSLALNIFNSLLWASWAIFLVNLLIHIIIRGFWIGAIGLRYVSGDIDFDQLNYSEKFTNHYKKRIGSFDQYIERLEKISSVIFSFTFLLFFMLLSFVAFNLVFALFVSLCQRFLDKGSALDQQIIAVFSLLYYGLGLLVLIDFFTLGAFKKIKEPTISTVYLWLYRFYSTVSLSFFYRPLLLNFIDNSYTRRLFFLAIPYGAALWLLGNFHMERYALFPSFEYNSDYSFLISNESINWRYYDDERDKHLNTFKKDGDRILKEKISFISLESYEIEGPLMKLFLEYRRDDDELLTNADKSLSLFRSKGLRHKLMTNSIKDAGIKKLDSLERTELDLLRKIVRQGQKEVDGNPKLVKSFQDIEKENYQIKRSEIKDTYREYRRQYMENKLISIKAELKNLYTIELDQEIVDEKLECEFYIHPNLHERGLLCYLNVDSLNVGKHSLRVWKKNSKGESTHRVVPFLKAK